jgi:hypothetical protein
LKKRGDKNCKKGKFKIWKCFPHKLLENYFFFGDFRFVENWQFSWEPMPWSILSISFLFRNIFGENVPKNQNIGSCSETFSFDMLNWVRVVLKNKVNRVKN